MSQELTLYDHKMRAHISQFSLALGTVAAAMLAYIGAPAGVCATLPMAAFSIPNIVWSVRDLHRK